MAENRVNEKINVILKEQIQKQDRRIQLLEKEVREKN